MAARHSKSKSSSLGPVVLVVAVVVVVFYLIKSGVFTVNKTAAPVAGTPKPKTTQNVTPNGVVNNPVMAGPAGWNHFAAKGGPKAGQVTLSWIRISPDSEKYAVVYGLVSGKYLYSVLNITDSTPKDSDYSYVVGALNSGKRYYFALIPQKGGTPTKPIDEISIVAP